LRCIDWDLKILKKKLAGKYFGHKLFYYSKTTSTNDKAFELGIAGMPEGTAVIADSQSRGKGRYQRSWYSPPGANIYTSLILRPQITPSEASMIPIMAGVAVAEVLNFYCSGRISLKWPNDVLINSKKVCGILSQAKMEMRKIDFIVLGIGINVNIGYNQFSKTIRDSATSIAIENGRKISRQDLVISLYENLEKWYKKLQKKRFGAIKQKWLKLSPMIGRIVQVKFSDETWEGKATGLDDDGSLILLTGENKEIKISAGDATIMR
jgi:BirA family biotin operon repressor/biotin-[acetyl-CoA-carboxylase] ligase